MSSDEIIVSLRQERDALSADLNLKNDYIKRLHAAIGYDNSDGFHSVPNPFAMIDALRECAAKAPVPSLAGTWPVVLFLPTEQDRDDLFEAMKIAKPHMTEMKLPRAT